MMNERVVPVHYLLKMKKLMNHVDILINSPLCPGVFIRELHCQWQDEESVLPGLMDTAVIVQTRGQVVIEDFPKPSQSVSVDQNELGLVPSGLPTRMVMSGDFNLMHLYLNPTLFASAALETLDMDPSQVQLKEQIKFNDQLIFAIGIALKEEALSGGSLGSLYAESLARALVIRLLAKHAVFTRQPNTLRCGLSCGELNRLVEYINNNLARELTLAELAGVVHISAYHLERLFKRATGQPLHQYVIARRIAFAQELIQTSSLTLAEIAGQVGFADQSHLTRNFKRLVGIPPGALLRERKDVQ